MDWNLQLSHFLVEGYFHLLLPPSFSVFFSLPNDVTFGSADDVEQAMEDERLGSIALSLASAHTSHQPLSAPLILYIDTLVTDLPLAIQNQDGRVGRVCEEGVQRKAS